MRGNWKRNAVLLTMAVLVCAAAALNWKYSAQEGADAAESAEAGTKILGEAALVSGGEGAEGTGDETAVYTGGDYFASARLTRQQARDNAISLLQEAAQQEGAGETAATEASEGIRQSPRGESVTEPTFGPSGRQLRLNCWMKKRR